MKRKRLVMFGMLFSGLLSGLALVGVSYGASADYKFTTRDIPLRFEFLGEAREDIVRFTDINKKGEIVGNNFAGDGFLIDKKHKLIEIRCPGDQTDNHSTVVSGINNVGQIVGSVPTAPSSATETARSPCLIFGRGGHGRFRNKRSWPCRRSVLGISLRASLTEVSRLSLEGRRVHHH